MALGIKNRSQPLLTSRGFYQPYQRPIAPAPDISAVVANTRSFVNAAMLVTGSRETADDLLDADNPAVIRRNARERNRVKQVNNGFLNLRQHIPSAIIADLSNGRRGIGPGANKKLSKVDTLRMAGEYIRRLKRVIDEVDARNGHPVSSNINAISSNSNSNSCHSDAYSSSSSSSSSYGNSPDNSGATNSPLSSPVLKAFVYSPTEPHRVQQQYFNSNNYTDNTIVQQQQQQQQQAFHQQHIFQQQALQYSLPISPVASHCSSTSSASSNCSTDSPYGHQQSQSTSQQLEQLHQQQQQQQLQQPSIGDPYDAAAMQFKCEQTAFDEYQQHTTTSSDDEDLLDYISLWQDDL